MAHIGFLNGLNGGTMDSRVLDQETLGKVVAMAPSIRIRPEHWAREIVRLLAKETQRPVYAETTSLAGELVFVLSLKTMCTLMADCPSPKSAGLIVGEMGLSKHRRNDGYRVVWTRGQVEVLSSALGVK
jgi:hypothetical protein